MRKKEFLPFLFLILLFLIGIYIISPKLKALKTISPTDLAQKYETAPTPTPTPKPLTFAEMNELYGPCVRLPVLMYHHIEDKASAEEKNQTALNVETEVFKTQMRYLKDQGYTVVSMNELISFFDNGVAPSPKSVILTFDDGYDDFSVNAAPILNEMGFKATIFISTGLIDNPGYLSWSNITSLGPSFYFGNHSWSHKNLQTTNEKVEFEITTGDKQLTERGLNSPKVFAYPYGLASDNAKSVLQKLEYKLAFSTKPGSTQCLKLRFDLPRVRIGNTPLSSYGF
jgi:peptidoglycan/xylan/chitin deacetylase (PgdA/CDA1 family)